ncbi:MAG: hypothetical protein KBC48_00530 [Candidatus Pacebacteria bacterium]|nr:hypothetical protein [Candidatus Paceibacterota bacterium]
MLAKRLLLGVVLLISLFFGPWWLTVIIGLFGLIYFKNYYEVAVVALLFDLIYGSASASPWLPLPFFLSSVVLLLIVSPLRYRLWY